jgi:hypothetical protein
MANATAPAHIQLQLWLNRSPEVPRPGKQKGSPTPGEPLSFLCSLTRLRGAHRDDLPTRACRDGRLGDPCPQKPTAANVPLPDSCGRAGLADHTIVSSLNAGET